MRRGTSTSPRGYDGVVIRRAFDWAFRDRRTGRVVVAQWPNPPLWVFLAASAVRRLADPEGTARTIVTAVATVALAWWAVDEMVRGVNPFRRALGVVVLAALVGGRLTR